MKFMNRSEVEYKYQWFKVSNRRDNVVRAVNALRDLVNWTDQNSDGWSSWPAPCNAAKKLIELLDHNPWEQPDISDDQLKKALSPIKAMFTRYMNEYSYISSCPLPASIVAPFA